MSDKLLLERITVDSTVMVGKPVIRGTRLAVEFILNLLAYGSTTQEIISEYKNLEVEDIQGCILFASKSLEEATFMPLTKKVA
jgi:uncharacterized protein (DUF433 family)